MPDDSLPIVKRDTVSAEISPTLAKEAQKLIARHTIKGEIISSKAKFSIFAEILFVLLPFLTATIIYSYKGRQIDLIYMSEWSLAASVLFGQSIVKNIYGLLSSKRKVRAERVAFSISLLVVFGLAPSLIVHSLVLVKSPDTSVRLAVSQFALFFLSLFSFYLYGGRGQTLSEETTSVE